MATRDAPRLGPRAPDAPGESHAAGAVGRGDAAGPPMPKRGDATRHTGVPAYAGTLKDSLIAAIAGLLVGLALHGATVYARDHGPTVGGYSLSGNGAIVLLLLAPVALLAGEVLCARRHAWLGMALLPLTGFLGLFVLHGGI